jgi:hypothetical protein
VRPALTVFDASLHLVNLTGCRLQNYRRVCSGTREVFGFVFVVSLQGNCEECFSERTFFSINQMHNFFDKEVKEFDEDSFSCGPVIRLQNIQGFDFRNDGRGA